LFHVCSIKNHEGIYYKTIYIQSKNTYGKTLYSIAVINAPIPFCPGEELGFGSEVIEIFWPLLSIKAIQYVEYFQFELKLIAVNFHTHYIQSWIQK
jgi:hypothetical protein